MDAEPAACLCKHQLTNMCRGSRHGVMQMYLSGTEGGVGGEAAIVCHACIVQTSCSCQKLSASVGSNIRNMGEKKPKNRVDASTSSRRSKPPLLQHVLACVVAIVPPLRCASTNQAACVSVSRAILRRGPPNVFSEERLHLNESWKSSCPGRPS